jgi:hypothetical protein
MCQCPYICMENHAFARNNSPRNDMCLYVMEDDDHDHDDVLYPTVILGWIVYVYMCAIWI